MDTFMHIFGGLYSGGLYSEGILFKDLHIQAFKIYYYINKIPISKITLILL